ncbi:hypothetical protein PAXRUDRAFT_14488 [Paxillus rubicundulus Ve08.2h10]|uniref:Uncharacterized protein n=1 Tax=Paxillus rubicundulus Ve08.2h10 TaxID=930991 RepID=A0A0D0CS97_9AGAM|nr:hypothetical protein PAXRUDRAFT_14488 [Paxillus rubicundulus Ve08.2h10]
MDIMDIGSTPFANESIGAKARLSTGLKQKTVFKCSVRSACQPDAHDIGEEWPPLQTDLCADPVTENFSADTLAAQIRHQATPEPCRIDYKEGLDDLIKRAMEDYQQMFSAACKCHRSVLKQQKMLVEELWILQMEWKKYVM